MADTLTQCREILEKQTPLQNDCGMVCGHACCKSMEGDETTGMLLFPGEAARYQNLPGWQVKKAAMGELVICPGHCDRTNRPLSCRLFPLMPVLRSDGVKVAMDRRAMAVCPLARQGLSAMQPAFVEAVRTCGKWLAADPEQAPFLKTLTAQQDELRALQHTFGWR